MIFGFGEHRRQLLESEVERIRAELPTLGIERAFLIGDFAKGKVKPTTGLEFLVVHNTDVPYTSRADFFTSHILPRAGCTWYVYTAEEFEKLSAEDGAIARAISYGEEIYAA